MFSSNSHSSPKSPEEVFAHTNMLRIFFSFCFWNVFTNFTLGVTITLIDLRNAFGEVDHNLIKHVMKYHHIPDDVCEHVVRLYSRFYTAVTTERYTTDFIRIEKGILQGDCLSPFIFNMLMNTFIQYIKGEEFSQFGYRWQKYILPKHWLQFADDAAAVTGLESENQILLIIGGVHGVVCQFV